MGGCRHRLRRAVFVLVAVALMIMMAGGASSNWPTLERHQVHSALRAVAWMVLANFRVHGTGVGRPPTRRGRRGSRKSVVVVTMVHLVLRFNCS